MADGIRPRSSTSSQTYAFFHPPLVLETLRLSTADLTSWDSSSGLPIVSRTKNVDKAHTETAISRAADSSWATIQIPQAVDGGDLGNEHRFELNTREFATVAPQTPKVHSTGTSYDSSLNGSATLRAPQRYISSTRSSPTSSVCTKTPPRPNSSCFSIQDESDDDNPMDAPNIGVRRSRDRHMVSALRERALRTRHLIRDRRDKLTQLRENFQNAADMFMRRVNETVAFNSIREELGADHDRVRTAQDALVVAGEEYDDLERRLELEERQLDNEGSYYYDNRNLSSSSLQESESDAEAPSFLRRDISRTESPKPNIEYDIIDDYLQKMTEAHHAREDLDDLEEDYFHFSNDASFRDKHDVVLSEEATSFLAEYSNRHAEIKHDLQRIETELLELRVQCLKEGLFAEDEHVYRPHDALVEDVMDSIYDAEDRSPLRVANYEAFDKEYQCDFEDRRDFVNHWLLEWIQDSTYECSLLKSWIYSTCVEYFGSAVALENKDWSKLAVQNWDNDAAGAHTDVFNSASMLDVIAGETRRVNASIGMSDFSGSWRSSDIDLDESLLPGATTNPG